MNIQKGMIVHGIKHADFPAPAELEQDSQFNKICFDFTLRKKNLAFTDALSKVCKAAIYNGAVVAYDSCGDVLHDITDRFGHPDLHPNYMNALIHSCPILMIPSANGFLVKIRNHVLIQNLKIPFNSSEFPYHENIKESEKRSRSAEG